MRLRMKRNNAPTGSAQDGGIFPPVKSELAVYALWLAPGVLGAALNWSWWLPLPLLVPGAVLYERLCRTAAQKRDPRLADRLPRNVEIARGIVFAVAGYVMLQVAIDRYFVLVCMSVWIGVLEPLQRMLWRWHDRSVQRPPPSPTST